MQTQSDFIVKLVLDAWFGQISRVDKLLGELNNEQLQREIAPGRNSGEYLIGHMAAIHDALLPLLELGPKLYPELENIFIKNPDKSGLQKPSLNLLRQYWNEINDALAVQFQKMSTEDWLKKHTVVSAEDFAKQPHRNKLNVLLSRTNHVSNHFGQLLLLKGKLD
jgi:hypothetical protein